MEPQFDGTKYPMMEIMSLLNMELMPKAIPEWVLARQEVARSTTKVVDPTEDCVSVHVRVRPQLSKEVEAGIGVLAGMATSSSDPSERSAVAFASESSEIGGFSSVLGPEANNEAVFQRTLALRLATVLQGGTTSLFSYGYTGSGKTHTVLGYNGEVMTLTL